MAGERLGLDPQTFRGRCGLKEICAMILRLVIGAVIGGGLGFAYYKFVGCSSGACPLTSNPVISTVYGSVVGALLASSFH
jgi:hypothetical protein